MSKKRQPGTESVDNWNMSQMGGPIQSVFPGAAAAQQASAPARAIRSRQQADTVRRFEDAFERTVAGTESAEAAQRTDEDGARERESAQERWNEARDRQQQHKPEGVGNADRPHIDLKG